MRVCRYARGGGGGVGGVHVSVGTRMCASIVIIYAFGM